MKDGAISGAQVRMARAFLEWSAVQLAEAAGVGLSTVQRIERDQPASPTALAWQSDARDQSARAIYAALRAAGITFLPPDAAGIGVRGKPAKRAR